MTEIALLLYPGAQMAAIHGLTDIFAVAGRLARDRLGPEALAPRVCHWSAGPDGVLACTFDNAPGMPHAPRFVIAPPSLAPLPTGDSFRPFADWMRAAHAGGAVLGSVCAGAFVLAETGLLDGRRATTHWGYAERLARAHPAIRVDAGPLVIDEGDIVTAGGVMAWTDLGLVLVERLMGPTLMLETARFLLIDPPGREQRPYERFRPRLDHGDAAILAVQHWLAATGAKGADLAAMTARARLEERTFLRRFRKATGLRPTEYCQQIRIEKAREMLELGNLPIDAVAHDVGYDDPASFRRLFQRLTGLSPGDYRRRFRAARD
ncbi:helix-turn-helix domain-containing protein [Zavarzinia compransoris]|uniref:GlxA family transcriptional regulator n=1 Tax=Zavarzinia marina TaxID=2911065 RepID=UPI001F365436|nr:helix-turn-helix domain-containing protein [Zavarzinia marina]MCF4166040.1 helix-turn-helix domain-containing protein [Zavarzinia marina]